MSTQTMTDAVKTADRIKGTQLDTEIGRLITWARAELERLGIPHDTAIGTDTLIEDAVIQGVLSKIARDDKLREAAQRSWDYQCDCLKKHDWTVSGT